MKDSKLFLGLWIRRYEMIQCCICSTLFKRKKEKNNNNKKKYPDCIIYGCIECKKGSWVKNSERFCHAQKIEKESNKKI